MRCVWKPTAENLAKVETLAEQGMTQEQIAPCIGIGVSTLYEKINKYPELLEALKKGKEKGIARVTEALLKNVEKGNVTAQIFYLKCRAGWKEARDEANVEAAQSLMQKLIDKLNP